METLIFICLVGVFSYNCITIGNEFRGSSMMAKSFISIIGSLGYVVYLTTIIWSFWLFQWWQPIVTFICSILVGATTAFIFQKNLLGILISPIALIVFSVLSIIRLIG